MKKINVKKLVALAAGAALVGSVVAPMATAAASDLEKGDVYSDSGSPIVNVVVGSTAAPSDFIWAGNIARKIVEKAASTEAVSVEGATADSSAAEIEVTIGGTTSVSGAQTFQDEMVSNSGYREEEFVDKNVTQGTVPSLTYYPDKSYVYNNSTSTTTMQEKLNFTADVSFDSITAKGLVASISAGNMKYMVDLGSGIPIYETSTSTTAFSDGSTDNIRIPFLGEDYLVKSISVSSNAASTLELVKSTAEKEYLEGDKIEGLVGKDGGEYYIVVGSGAAYDGTTKINLSIFDSEGNQAASDQQFASSETVQFYNDAGTAVLDTSITLSTLGTTTSDNSTIYKPFFLIGTDRLELKHNNGYPYDSTLTSSDYSYWTTLVTDGNKLKRIEIATRSKLAKTGTNALKAEESIDFMNDYATLKFVGLQLPEFTDASKTERVTPITIGDGKLEFKDNTNEQTQSLPFYTLGQSFSSYDSYSALPDTIAGKDVYAKINTKNVDLNITDGYSLNGITLDLNLGRTAAATQVIQVCYTDPRTTNAVCDDNADGSLNIGGLDFGIKGGTTIISDPSGNDTNAGVAVQIVADGYYTLRYNTNEDDNGSTQLISSAIAYYADNNVFTAGFKVQPAGQTSGSYRYAPMLEEIQDNIVDLWLFLSKQDITTQYSKTLSLNGTDVDEDKIVQSSVANNLVTLDSFPANVPYYLPHSASLPQWIGGDSNFTSADIYVAQFLVDDDESGAATPDINVMIDTATGNMINVSSGTQLSNYSTEVTYDRNQNSTSVTWGLSSQLTNYASTGYTDFGTKVVVDSTKTALTTPENLAKAEIRVEGESTTTTTSGGDTITVKAGEAETTASGTVITIGDINGVTVSGGTGSDVAVRAPLNNKAKVILDTSTDVGPAISVGGHKVNKLTAKIEGIADKLNKAGDAVVEKSGDTIVVAGYLGVDTGKAAQELIDWLDTLE